MDVGTAKPKARMIQLHEERSKNELSIYCEWKTSGFVLFRKERILLGRVKNNRMFKISSCNKREIVVPYFREALHI